LPAEIRPYFQKHLGFIVEHAIDPDLWGHEVCELRRSSDVCRLV